MGVNGVSVPDLPGDFVSVRIRRRVGVGSSKKTLTLG